MSSFATIEELNTLFRPLTASEQEKAESLLPLVSDALREEGKKAGKDLDEMITEDPAYGSVVKLVCVDVVSRILRQSTEGDLMSQESQTGLGYNWQGTYAIPGGGIAGAIMNNDLKRLGLKRQRLGVIDLYA